MLMPRSTARARLPLRDAHGSGPLLVEDSATRIYREVLSYGV